ncbi:MAG: ATP-binding protein [Flaviaesturariibacter sp.]|nr:ATP-binding protein [Flaviaesturariibacter sp.]
MYVIGKTGVGKSTLLLNMAISDIARGNGLAVLDPHGDLAETLLDHIPNDRISDVIYFNATDTAFPVGFNPLTNIPRDRYNLVVSELISAFKNIWSDSWGPRLEYMLRFSLLTLLEYPGATLLDIQPLLTNQAFRNNVLTYVTQMHVYAFWKTEFDKYLPSFRTEAITSILNKTGVFITSDVLKNIVGQKKNTIDIQTVLKEKKILIINVAKGVVGEEVSAILGSFLVTAIQVASLSRASLQESQRTPFYLYVDEMHTFITLSFAGMLSESRKYGLALFLTHQYIDQLPERVRNAVFGNVGTLISFRVGAEDAYILHKEMHPYLNENDFIQLPRFSMYLKLMIDGAASKPFSAQSLPLTAIKGVEKEELIKRSRDSYAVQKEKLEFTVLPIEQKAKQDRLF